MKITQIMLSKGFGGAERYFVELSIALSELGHDVQIICHDKFTALDQLKAHGLIKIDTASMRGWWDVFGWRCLQDDIFKFNPDIVHAHLARGAYIAGKACSHIKKPLIVKTHNYVNLKYYRKVDRFITTTDDQKEYLIKHGIQKYNIDVIPNFSSIKPASSPQFTGNRVLNMVAYGRFVKIKGMHVLLNAFKTFIDSGRAGLLHIGGSGPEEKNLKSLCKKLDLDKHVIFYGWIDDVEKFVSNFDIVVLPSLSESFGIVVLESIAMGKPLIATRTKGPLQILNDGVAYLVEPGNPAELFIVLCKAADDRSGRMKKAELALKLFKRKYTKSNVVPKVVNAYKQAIEKYSK